MGAERGSEHPSAEEVAAYLDRALAADERRRVEAHLSECPACLNATALASRQVGSWRRRRRRRIYVPTAAAAVLVGLLAVGLGVGRDAAVDEARFRGPKSALLQDESLRSIEAVRPHDGGALPAAEPAFVWRVVEAGALYRFTLTDGGGDVLWRGSTRDTVLSLASELLLTPGEEYFWYVDALVENGASATSGIRSFRATREP